MTHFIFYCSIKVYSCNYCVNSYTTSEQPLTVCVNASKCHFFATFCILNLASDCFNGWFLARISGDMDYPLYHSQQTALLCFPLLLFPERSPLVQVDVIWTAVIITVAVLLQLLVKDRDQNPQSPSPMDGILAEPWRDENKKIMFHYRRCCCSVIIVCVYYLTNLLFVWLIGGLRVTWFINCIKKISELMRGLFAEQMCINKVSLNHHACHICTFMLSLVH